MKCLVLGLFVLVAVASADNGWSIPETGIFQATRIEGTYPKPTERVDVNVYGKLTATVTGGNVHVETFYEGINVGSSDGDLCQIMAAEGDTHCPWTASDNFDLESTFVVQDGLPSGSYYAVTTFTTKDGTLIVKLQSNFSV